MGGRTAPAWDLPADPPSEVRITIVPGPRGRLVEWLSSRSRTLAIAVVLCAAIAAWLGIETHSSADPVTAAYRYPLGCLGVALSAGDTASRLDRTSPCWRYGVYVTAILRESHGEWRLALEAISDSCPHVRLPAVVRAQVAVCARAHVAGRLRGGVARPRVGADRGEQVDPGRDQ